MTDRQILRLSGEDRVDFLQGLVTNDVKRAEQDGIVYAALLTPQGKYIADFFVVSAPDSLLIDVAQSHAAQLLQRLSLYRLRAKVDIAPVDVGLRTGVADGSEAAPAGALPDPRHPALGWRCYGHDGPRIDTLPIRVAACIPETGLELTPDSYILECGFERLNGVDFRKGCYVGQEVTARMKHKTTLRKGLAPVEIEGAATFGSEITSGERSVGTLLSRYEGRAIAYLRFDRLSDEMYAGDARVYAGSL